MPKGPTDLTKLAIETRNLIDSQQEDFSIGQVAIMNIMICISRFIEERGEAAGIALLQVCLLYTSPSPRDRQKSRMPSSA